MWPRRVKVETSVSKVISHMASAFPVFPEIDI